MPPSRRRRAKDRAPRASGRSPTARSAGRASRVSARRSGNEARHDRRGRRQQVVGRGEDARPARGTPERVSPEPNSLAKCSEVRRATPGSPIAPPDQAANTAAVWAGTAGVTSRTPGGRLARRGAAVTPWSGVTRSPRPSTSAAPLPRKNGTSLPRPAASARRCCRVELGAPRLERAVERRGGVARAAGEPGGDGDPLLEADGERRRGAPTGRADGPRAQPRPP